MANLQEITGQESGIIVYDDKVMVINWASICPDGGLPIMSPINTVMEWPQDEPLTVTEQYDVEDIRTVLPGKIETRKDEDGEIELEIVDMEILEDYNGDILALWGFATEDGAEINTDDAGNLVPTAGTVYKIKDAIVIAPDGWN